MSWRQVEREAPEIATAARAEFERTSMAVIATLRADGSPRISCIEPVVLAGEMYLGMMWGSRKAADLLRDPRL